jgi:AraC family transcriptional regulator of adaptative response / DNA-3-methyladenine glycosylase II
MLLDDDRCWQALEAGDARFDGWIFCGVTTTGTYCRPSCPARTPKRDHVRFFTTAAGAQAAGHRACKRCRPDATPGSPEWDARADVVGRAMRLIADGVVDREGVTGLARRLGYTERHVHRQLVAAVGVGPLALARSQRAQTARILLETTNLPMTDVAFAAGFHSVRQFNASIHEVFALSPTGLRAQAGGTRAQAGGTRAQSGGTHAQSGGTRAHAGGTRALTHDAGIAVDHCAITLRLSYRAPLHASGLIDYLARRAVRGVEELVDGVYRRSLRLPQAAGVMELAPAEGHFRARFWLEDRRDLAAAVQRSRTLLDLDSDPVAVDARLAADPLLAPLVTAAPGRRVPGYVDGDELAVRAVLGQQVSVAGAATLAARLVSAYGEPLERPVAGVTHLFPSAAALASCDAGSLAMPRARAGALTGLARALAEERIALDAGADREQTIRRLLALPGVGAWTAGYVAMRALRDPDAFLPTDLGVRRGLERLGENGAPDRARALAERWRPYRAYALQHLWAQAALAAAAPEVSGTRLAA